MSASFSTESTTVTLPPPSFSTGGRATDCSPSADVLRDTLCKVVDALEGTELRLQQLRRAHSSPHMTHRDLDDLMRLEYQYLADTSQSVRTILGNPRSQEHHSKYRKWVPEYTWGANCFDPQAYEDDFYKANGRHKYVSPKLSRKADKRQRLSGIIAQEKVSASPFDHDQCEQNHMRSCLKFTLPPTMYEPPDVAIPCMVLFPDYG